ncbi:MAG: hypothetical protein NZ553_16150 [Caldilinea sp.]|nr:hypothetical protein [Caldilinea sp.]MDW8442010.1 hypothetical protein [Caldilineaceae bacterium]
MRKRVASAPIVHCVRSSALVRTESGLRLIDFPKESSRYVNAQVDDYWTGWRRTFRWRPPLRLSLRARFSHEADALRGTAGFGFWNDPFLMTGLRRPALPRALWFFFASPPSDMALTLDVPGRGWKAAVIDAGKPTGLRWLPPAPVLVPAMRISWVHARLWPRIQRDLGIAEASIPFSMTAWRHYEILWGVRRTTFWVDGEPVLQDAPSPRGPMGLVIWIDNQYLVVHPSGRFRHGVLALSEAQWLEVAEVEIQTDVGE